MAAHWSDAWLGIQYVHQVQDCAVLCEQVQRAVFGRALALPTARGETWHDFTAVIQAHKAEYLRAVDEPADGDCVMLIGRGRCNHLAVFCWIAGEAWVLHAMEAAGESVRHRLRDLPRLGLAIEGYYRWK